MIKRQSMMSQPTLIKIPARAAVGYRLDVPPQTQHQREQDGRSYHSRNLGPAAGSYVHDCAHRGAGAGEAPYEPGDGVTDSLAHQLPVGVVTRAGDRVGHEGREQAVNGAEQRNDQRGLDGARNDVQVVVRQFELR